MRAPISGTVIERKVTLGQAVERATDAFKIADTTHVWVSLDLYEKDLARVHVGQEVEMRTDARPGELFRGRVAFIVPVIDEATRTAKVRLEFPNPNGMLHAGQLVTARILADPKLATNEVLAVPRSAIEQVEGKTVVFVQARRGVRAAERPARDVGGRQGRDPEGAQRGRNGGRRRRVSAQERALEMSLASIVAFAVRRRGVVLAIWARGLRVRAGRRCAICRSTPSPTSPTPRCRS